MKQVKASPLDIDRLVGSSKLTDGDVRYSRLLRQISAGSAWAIYARAGDAPVAVWGVTPWPGRQDTEPAEAWFSTGAGADRQMPAIVAAIRPLLKLEAKRHPCGVITRVKSDNAAGLRLGWCLGFAFEETGEIFVGRLV
jgi:hypothetical protein